MKSAVDPHEKTGDTPQARERGYDAWKRAKVERGLAQAQDRSSMIPADRILRDFGLES